jgi:hypothetical protein
MAKAKNPLGIRGTIDGFTYYEYRGQPCVRRKSSLNKEDMLNNPAFELPLQAASRFGEASKAAAAIRWAIAPFDKAFADNLLTERLVTLTVKVFNENHACINSAGVDFCSMDQALKCFEWNAHESFAATLNADIDATHDTENDQLQLDIHSTTNNVFSRAESSTFVRYHIMFAPIGLATVYRKYEPDRDLALEASWTSPWLPSDAPHRLQETIKVPWFLRKGKPILVMLAVEPGTSAGGQYYTCQVGRGLKALGMI